MKQSELIKMNYVKEGVEYTPQYTVEKYEPIKKNNEIVDFELIGFKLIKTAQEVAEQKQIDNCLEPPKTNKQLTEENKLLKEQVKALTEANDFQEELIVEMAALVYA